MILWNPARMSEDRQMELDIRVILNIAEDKLRKDLDRVEKKMEKHRERFMGNDSFSTRKQRANMNIRADELAYEKNTVLRRLDLIKEVRDQFKVGEK